MESSMLKILLVAALFASSHGFCGPRKLNGDLTRAAVKAAEWLKSQFNETIDFGGGHARAHALHSLRLLGHDVTHGARSLADELAREGLGRISGGRLALYVLGVMAACEDPLNFAGQDLVKELQGKLRKYPTVGFNHPFQYNLAVLTLCTAGASIKYNQVARLVSRTISHQVDDVDTLSVGVVAARCINRKQNKQSKKLRTYIKRAATHLKRVQEKSGGSKFGTEISTANGVMAMLAAGAGRRQWNCTATMEHLLSFQEKDGSFRTIGHTISILPVLVGALPYDIADLECPTAVSVPKPKDITVCVKMEFGKNTVDKTPAGEEYFVVENGTNTHDLLKLARQKNSCFNFTTQKFSFGHSLTSLCSVQINHKDQFYWMIYVAEDSVKPEKPAAHGIDDLKPADGSCVIFKYEKVSWK